MRIMFALALLCLSACSDGYTKSAYCSFPQGSMAFHNVDVSGTAYPAGVWKIQSKTGYTLYVHSANCTIVKGEQQDE